MAADQTTTGNTVRVPLGPTLRVFARAVAEPTLHRILPIYVGLGIVAAVLFGPTGMSAADVTEAAGGSVGVRLGLWALWLTALAPAARGLLVAPAGFYLRALPVPRWHHYGLVTSSLGLLQLPWAWLWLRGDGVGAAAAATAMAMAMLATHAIRPRHPFDRVAVVVTIAVELAAIGVGLAWPILLGIGGCGAAVAVVTAWRRAPEVPAPGWSAPIAGPAGLASAVAVIALLLRRRAASFARGALVVALGAAVTVLAARANQVTEAGLLTVSLAIAALTMAMIAGSFAIAALEIERASRWLLDSTGTGGATRVIAATLAVVVIAGLFGGAHGAAVAWGAGPAGLAPRLIGGAMVQGFALASIAVTMARYAERPSGVDGTLVVAGLIVLVVGVVIATAVLGEIALFGLCGLALLAAVASVGRAAQPSRRRRRSW